MSISFFGSTTGTAASISLPASTQAGDLAILFDRATGSGSFPTDVIPTGFTRIGATQTGGTTIRANISYKVLVGGESSITGMDGVSGDSKLLLVFRKTTGTWGTPQDVTEESTAGNPAAQTVNVGTAPLVIVASYNSSAAISPRTFSTTADGEVARITTQYAAYKIYNSSPADTTIDMDDEGTFNILSSFYFSAVDPAIVVSVVSGGVELDGAIATVTASDNKVATVVSGAVELAGATPTIALSDNKLVAVSPGVAEIAGATGTVAASDHKTVDAAPGALELSGSTASVVVGQFINVVSGSIEAAGATLSASVTDHRIVTVVAGGASFSGSIPGVVVNAAIDVIPGSIKAAGATPIVSTTAHVTVDVQAGAIVIIGGVPTVIGTIADVPSEGARGGGGARRQHVGSAKVRRHDIDQKVKDAYQRILARRAAAEAQPVPPSPKAVLRAVKAEPDGNEVTLAQVRAAMLRLDSVLARLQAEIANDDEEAAFMLLAA